MKILKTAYVVFINLISNIYAYTPVNAQNIEESVHRRVTVLSTGGIVGNKGCFYNHGRKDFV